VPVNVTSPDLVQDAIDDAASGSKALRAVVNCAGIGPSARIMSRKGPHDLTPFPKIVQVNLVGPSNVMTLAAEKIAATETLADGQRGAIVNTERCSVRRAGQAAYASSKGGIVGPDVARRS
jgi:NAD(P)-dependent dehydrogenase (short-subunit alcohol dehydrogenase family)